MYFIRDYNGPKSYQVGTNPDVLVLGQDPTINRSTRFETVLGLGASVSSSDRQSVNLQNYIFGKILSPLGIDKSRITATNLVNLHYYDIPNGKIAKTYKDLILSMAEKEGIDVAQYPDKTNGAILHALNFKAKTQQDFEDILGLSSIRHLITLGEPVFQVLKERYNLELDAKIKDVLALIDDRPKVVEIAGKEISFLPLPHIFNENNSRWKFYKLFLRDNLPRLRNWYNKSM